MPRTILHVDMDAFFAAVEQADDPALKGKPVIVGGSTRGVVSTASYEAREYGIRSAMPMFEARQRCPRGIFLPVRMERYHQVSQQIMAIFRTVSPLVEPVSIDEAFIDLTGTEKLHGDSLQVAAKIKQEILICTALTCSIGIAPNKFLAKIASDMHKPDGLTVIREEDVAGFLDRLPVARLPGVGARSEETLRGLGICRVSDIRRFPPSVLEKRFGRFGARLLELANGVDPSPVIPYSPVKSLGSESTLPEDTKDRALLKKWLISQAEEIGERLRANDLKGRTVTVKVKYADFSTETRSRTLQEPTCATKTLFDTAVLLLEEHRLDRPVRLVGLSVSRFDESPQYRLFPGDISEEKLERSDRAVDRIRRKLGKDIIKRGSTIDSEP